MDNRKSDLLDHEKALQKLTEYADTLYLSLGKYLFENQVKQLKEPYCSEILKKIRSLHGESKKITGEIKMLREMEEKLEGLKKEIQALDSKRKETEKIIPSLYEDIGSLAYTLYKKNTASFEQYESHFFALKSYDDEIFSIEETIRKKEEEEKEKPFFEKIAGRGQKALLLGKKLLKTRSFPDYCRTLGENLLSAGYFSNAPLPELMTIQEELNKKQEEVKMLASSAAEKEGEVRKLETALREQKEGKKTGKKITELKKSIDEAEQTTVDGYRELGVLCFEKRPPSIQNDKEAQRLYREIQENVNQTEFHTAETVKLKNEIEYLKLSEKIEIKRRSITSCKSSIEKYQLKIENLEREIEALEKERKQLKI